jgi:hypothetical protein
MTKLLFLAALFSSAACWAIIIDLVNCVKIDWKRVGYTALAGMLFGVCGLIVYQMFTEKVM